MIIKLKNKDTLIVGEFKLKCSIGKKGISKNKFEGDLRTPTGKFKLGNLYWRSDRVKKPETKLFCKKIKKNMAWCNDSNSSYYNKEINTNKNVRYEKLYRYDNKYDLFILIKYNYYKTKKKKVVLFLFILLKIIKLQRDVSQFQKKIF